jgi:hypothetical protein
VLPTYEQLDNRFWIRGLRESCTAYFVLALCGAQSEPSLTRRSHGGHQGGQLHITTALEGDDYDMTEKGAVHGQNTTSVYAYIPLAPPISYP